MVVGAITVAIKWVLLQLAISPGPKVSVFVRVRFEHSRILVSWAAISSEGQMLHSDRKARVL